MQAKKKEPDFVISVHCTRSAISEDNIVGVSVRFGKLIASEESRYPASEGEALTKEFLKGISKLQELIELEAKNNPVMQQRLDQTLENQAEQGS